MASNTIGKLAKMEREELADFLAKKSVGIQARAMSRILASALKESEYAGGIECALQRAIAEGTALGVAAGYSIAIKQLYNSASVDLDAMIPADNDEVKI